jgi:hypothetical protein
VNEVNLLHELAPEAERLLERHVVQSKEWFPHALVPWDEVVKHDPRDQWSEELAPMIGWWKPAMACCMRPRSMTTGSTEPVTVR